MSDTISKSESLEEEAESFSGIGNPELWFQTTTYPFTEKNISNKTIIRDLLEEFRIWNQSWDDYAKHSEYLKPPINADEFIEKLNQVYTVNKK